MQPKLLFLLPNNKDITYFINDIEIINDDIVIANRFIDDIQYKDSENINGFYYFKTVSDCFKRSFIIQLNCDICLF